MEDKIPRGEFMKSPFRVLHKFGGKVTSMVLPRPDFVIDDVHDLTIEGLNGVSKSTQVIIFDIEGTLENYGDKQVSESTLSLISSLKSAGLTVAINSNTSNPERSKTVHEMFDGLLGEDLVITSHDLKSEGKKKSAKPFPTMINLVEERIQARGLTWKKSQFLMVGDQLLKDTLAGKNANVRTLHVNRYGDSDHKNVLKFQRPIEAMMLRMMGAPALKKTMSGYVPFELPDAITSWQDFVGRSRSQSS